MYFIYLFLALSFALSDRIQINRSEFNGYFHHGIDIIDSGMNQEDKSIEV
jgi:hypothetical protein